MIEAKWKLTRNADGVAQVEEWGERGPKFGSSLMGAAEIRSRLGLTRGSFDVLSVAEYFPEPVAALNSGRVWLTEDIEAWITTCWPRLAQPAR